MSENTNDEFNFFATSKRVKKEEPGPYKSPLDTGSKWDIKDDIELSLKNEKRATSHIETQKSASQEGISRPATPTPTYSNEEIGNIGSELQKFRKYPQKTYDKFLNKMVTFNEEEFYLIRDLSAEISIARKRSNISNKGSLPRITENTVIRAALKAVFSKLGSNSTDLSTLQTEEALESYFNSLLK